jgi:glycosyltransferase involved in cell wall biosynthesis
MAKRSERPLAVHLAYLAEACRVLPWLHANRIQHLHAHFGTNAAEVALLIHALGGPTWSFTVHGPEEFDKASFIGLGQKIRCCAFVAAISSFGRSQLYRCVEQKFWPKVHLVHCGLESKMFALQSKSQMSTKRFVCVGRLCEQKGQLLLVDAARRLVPKWPDLELVLAGDGELRPDLEAQINAYGLQRNIRITGWISGDQVRDEILAARALVLPSFAEGLPVVIMEAMALKRPVISTFVGGIPELVRAGEDGWLVPAGDVEALTQAMQVCLDQSEIVLARMGEAANLRVLAHHSVDAEAAKLASLFQSAIEEASSA